MKKIALFLFLASSSFCFGQKLNNKISFQKGRTLHVNTEVTSSTAMDLMGQTMNSSVTSTVAQDFNVTDAGKNSTSMDHSVKSIKFKAEGMGQSQTFDSDNENDRSGEIGKSLASSLKAKYSITVDAKGNITSVKADTGSTASKTDPMLGMLLAQLSVSTTPPKVGDATIFKILPDKEVSKGSSWTDSTSDETGKKITVYAITNVTDKEIFIDFTDNSTLNTTQQIMGFDAKINTKSNGNGQIIIDRSTGILKQKKASVKSEQTIEAQGQKLPSTANLTIVTTVL